MGRFGLLALIVLGFQHDLAAAPAVENAAGTVSATEPTAAAGAGSAAEVAVTSNGGATGTPGSGAGSQGKLTSGSGAPSTGGTTTSSNAPSSGGTPNPFASGDAFRILTLLFVLAVLLEQALAAIFSWRLFIQKFDGRGVKPLLAVIFGYLLLEVCHLDLVAELVNSYTAGHIAPGPLTKGMAALILAGGSNGVNSILVNLKFRTKTTAEDLAPKPRPDKAWLAVRLIRKNAKGDVRVLIGETSSGEPAVAGIISGSSSGRNSYFLVDQGRFPRVGGYEVTPIPGEKYLVKIEGTVERDRQLSEQSASWGPYPLAAGAVVDVNLTL